MRLVTNIVLTDGAYHASVDLTPQGLSPVEEEALSHFGEPIIQCGGEFTDGDALTFTLPENHKRFPSQFPVKKRFAIEDFPDDAADMALLWRDTIKARIAAAVTAKRNTSAGTTGEEISVIDTSN